MSSVSNKIVVTEVDFRVHEKDKLIGFANVTLNDALVIRGVRLINGSKGKFVSFPSREAKKDEYIEICFVKTPELRQHILDSVIASYQQMKSGKGSTSQGNKSNYSKPAKSDSDDAPF